MFFAELWEKTRECGRRGLEIILSLEEARQRHRLIPNWARPQLESGEKGRGDQGGSELGGSRTEGWGRQLHRTNSH